MINYIQWNTIIFIVLTILVGAFGDSNILNVDTTLETINVSSKINDYLKSDFDDISSMPKLKSNKYDSVEFLQLKEKNGYSIHNNYTKEVDGVLTTAQCQNSRQHNDAFSTISNKLFTGGNNDESCGRVLTDKEESSLVSIQAFIGGTILDDPELHYIRHLGEFIEVTTVASNQDRRDSSFLMVDPLCNPDLSDCLKMPEKSIKCFSLISADWYGYYMYFDESNNKIKLYSPTMENFNKLNATFCLQRGPENTSDWISITPIKSRGDLLLRHNGPHIYACKNDDKFGCGKSITEVWEKDIKYKFIRPTFRGTCRGPQNPDFCKCAFGHLGPACGARCPNANKKTKTLCNGTGTCEYIRNNATCVCHSGYYGQGCQYKCIFGNNNKICSGNGECRQDCEIAECICKPGFIGNDCSVLCPSSDANNGVICNGHGTCDFDYTGKSICKCHEGYIGLDCSLKCPANEFGVCSTHGTCQINIKSEKEQPYCVCREGYLGHDCSLACPINPYNGQSCSGYGKCDTNKLGNPSCKCQNGFIGDSCQGKCPLGTGMHKNKVCSGRGKCKMNDHGLTFCQCDSSYIGINCGGSCPTDENSNICYGHGECVYDEKLDIGICLCNAGYVGQNCNHKCPGFASVPLSHPSSNLLSLKSLELLNNDPSMAIKPCHGNGQCILFEMQGESDQAKCVCNVGFKGRDCSKKCPIDDNGITCAGQGQCQFGPLGDLQCKCQSGFMGPACQHECPGRLGNHVCYNQGKCVFNEKLELAICICKHGFNGIDCSLECPGRMNDDVTFCSGHGRCRVNNELTSSECQCDQHYYGKECNKTCLHDGPNTSICNDRGECVFENDEATCQCIKNYKGSNCQYTCPLDENGNICSKNGECIINENKKMIYCLCHFGFTGERCSFKCPVASNGLVCAGKGSCELTGGRASCECLSGWSGIDCHKSTCGSDLSIFIPDEKQCVCEMGYTCCSAETEAQLNNMASTLSPTLKPVASHIIPTGPDTSSTPEPFEEPTAEPTVEPTTTATSSHQPTVSTITPTNQSISTEHEQKEDHKQNSTPSIPKPHHKGQKHDEEPHWSYDDWSTCSQLCGGGIRNRVVKCMLNNTEALLSSCKRPKPSSSEECNHQLCAAWEVSTWGDCSVQCGGGFQIRDVSCKDISGAVITEIGTRCDVNKKPEDKQECNLDICPTWQVDNWTPCNVKCGGGGVQTRNVYCKKNGVVVENQNECSCDDLKPVAQQSCESDILCTHWYSGEWSPCSNKCDQGYNIRIVICEDSELKRVDDSRCDCKERPAELKTCTLAACPKVPYIPQLPCPIKSSPTVLPIPKLDPLDCSCSAQSSQSEEILPIKCMRELRPSDNTNVAVSNVFEFLTLNSLKPYVGKDPNRPSIRLKLMTGHGINSSLPTDSKTMQMIVRVFAKHVAEATGIDELRIEITHIDRGIYITFDILPALHLDEPLSLEVMASILTQLRTQNSLLLSGDIGQQIDPNYISVLISGRTEDDDDASTKALHKERNDTSSKQLTPCPHNVSIKSLKRDTRCEPCPSILKPTLTPTVAPIPWKDEKCARFCSSILPRHRGWAISEGLCECKKWLDCSVSCKSLSSKVIEWAAARECDCSSYIHVCTHVNRQSIGGKTLLARRASLRIELTKPDNIDMTKLADNLKLELAAILKSRAEYVDYYEFQPNQKMITVTLKLTYDCVMEIVNEFVLQLKDPKSLLRNGTYTHLIKPNKAFWMMHKLHAKIAIDLGKESIERQDQKLWLEYLFADEISGAIKQPIDLIGTDIHLKSDDSTASTSSTNPTLKSTISSNVDPYSTTSTSLPQTSKSESENEAAKWARRQREHDAKQGISHSTSAGSSSDTSSGGFWGSSKKIKYKQLRERNSKDWSVIPDDIPIVRPRNKEGPWNTKWEDGELVGDIIIVGNDPIIVAGNLSHAINTPGGLIREKHSVGRHLVGLLFVNFMNGSYIDPSWKDLIPTVSSSFRNKICCDLCIPGQEGAASALKCSCNDPKLCTSDSSATDSSSTDTPAQDTDKSAISDSQQNLTSTKWKPEQSWNDFGKRNHLTKRIKTTKDEKWFQSSTSNINKGPTWNSIFSKDDNSNSNDDTANNKTNDDVLNNWTISSQASSLSLSSSTSSSSTRHTKKNTDQRFDQTPNSTAATDHKDSDYGGPGDDINDNTGDHGSASDGDVDGNGQPEWDTPDKLSLLTELRGRVLLQVRLNADWNSFKSMIPLLAKVIQAEFAQALSVDSLSVEVIELKQDISITINKLTISTISVRLIVYDIDWKLLVTELLWQFADPTSSINTSKICGNFEKSTLGFQPLQSEERVVATPTPGKSNPFPSSSSSSSSVSISPSPTPTAPEFDPHKQTGTENPNPYKEVPSYVPTPSPNRPTLAPTITPPTPTPTPAPTSTPTPTVSSSSGSASIAPPPPTPSPERPTADPNEVPSPTPIVPPIPTPIPTPTPTVLGWSSQSSGSYNPFDDGSTPPPAQASPQRPSRGPNDERPHTSPTPPTPMQSEGSSGFENSGSTDFDPYATRAPHIVSTTTPTSAPLKPTHSIQPSPTSNPKYYSDTSTDKYPIICFTELSRAEFCPTCHIPDITLGLSIEEMLLAHDIVLPAPVFNNINWEISIKQGIAEFKANKSLKDPIRSDGCLGPTTWKLLIFPVGANDCSEYLHMTTAFQILIYRYNSVSNITSRYCKGTINKTMRFQRRNNLDAHGDADEDTWIDVIRFYGMHDKLS